MSVWLAALSISVVGLGYMALQFHLQVDARIHVLPELFTVAECKSIVRVANGANAWTTGRHAYFPTDDVQLSAVPALANISAPSRLASSRCCENASLSIGMEACGRMEQAFAGWRAGGL